MYKFRACPSLRPVASIGIGTAVVAHTPSSPVAPIIFNPTPIVRPPLLSAPVCPLWSSAPTRVAPIADPSAAVTMRSRWGIGAAVAFGYVAPAAAVDFVPQSLTPDELGVIAGVAAFLVLGVFAVIGWSRASSATERQPAFAPPVDRGPPLGPRPFTRPEPAPAVLPSVKRTKPSDFVFAPSEGKKRRKKGGAVKVPPPHRCITPPPKRPDWREALGKGATVVSHKAPVKVIPVISSPNEGRRVHNLLSPPAHLSATVGAALERHVVIPRLEIPLPAPKVLQSIASRPHTSSMWTGTAEEERRAYADLSAAWVEAGDLGGFAPHPRSLSGHRLVGGVLATRTPDMAAYVAALRDGNPWDVVREMGGYTALGVVESTLSTDVTRNPDQLVLTIASRAGLWWLIPQDRSFPFALVQTESGRQWLRIGWTSERTPDSMVRANERRIATGKLRPGILTGEILLNVFLDTEPGDLTSGQTGWQIEQLTALLSGLSGPQTVAMVVIEPAAAEQVVTIKPQ